METVSYTHLDVYKRQALIPEGTRENDPNGTGYQPMAETADLRLDINPDTTAFRITVKQTGYVWESSVGSGADGGDQAMLSVSYMDASGVAHYMDTFNDSVKKGQFDITKTDKGVKIAYSLGEIAAAYYALSLIHIWMSPSCFIWRKAPTKSKWKWCSAEMCIRDSVQLIPRDTQRHVVFLEIRGVGLTDFLLCQIRYPAAPDLMGAAPVLDGGIEAGLGGDIRVGPEIELQPLPIHPFHKGRGVREAFRIPVECAGISARLPTGFQTDDRQRYAVFGKLGRFLFHLFGCEQRMGAVPEAESPQGRQAAAAAQ